jgi:hypothetical protein
MQHLKEKKNLCPSLFECYALRDIIDPIINSPFIRLLPQAIDLLYRSELKE